MGTKKAAIKKTSLPAQLRGMDADFIVKSYEELIADMEIGNMVGNEKAAAGWQDPSNFSSNSVFVDQTIAFFAAADDDSKAKDVNFRELQKKCWEKYKLFGPLNAAIESKADYVCGAGFEVYSEDISLRRAVRELIFSPRNKLYRQHTAWVIRMLVENELFLLIALDDFGLATVRIVEPDRIGQATDDGLVVDPDDVAQTVFYKFYATAGMELIPDARFILEPEFMLDRQKALLNSDAIKPDDIKKLTKNARFKKATGGYRRFILHWKNLTGEPNIRRDTSSLITTLKWINLYTKALEWELDYKKALAAYTIEISFDDTAGGKTSWLKWSKMSDEQKLVTGLTSPLMPGGRVFTMPGMSLELHAPQLSTGTGTNQDLLNLAGAGARTPQDMFQGQAAGATYASLQSSRPPLEADIENLQGKLMHFHKYEFMNCVLTALSKIGKRVTYAGDKQKILPTYKEIVVSGWVDGAPTYQEMDCYPHDRLLYKFPQVKLTIRPNESMNAGLGSKHAGAYSVGASAETVAKMVGVDGLPLEKERQALEQKKWGIPITGGQAESGEPANKPGDEPAAPGTPTKKADKTEGDAGKPAEG